MVLFVKFMRRLVVCTTCKFSAEAKFAADGRTGGEILIDHLQASVNEQKSDVVIAAQACLWNCTRPCSVAFHDDERFSYITGGHEPTREQADAILAWFAHHGATERGEVPFREWPSRMRGHFIARLPPVMS